ncbi:monocarboxylate transporter 5-like [Babylonia areolata]|uniref:monocarboxylate transporter 5-like n=1 Tax=Babylonia areolata TaxID=304850 RepID=UPI003FCFC888
MDSSNTGGRQKPRAKGDDRHDRDDWCLKTEKDRTGQEKDRTGQEKDGTGQEKDRTGQEKDRTGQEKDRTGQEKDRTGQEKDRTGQEKDRTGQEKDRTGREKDRKDRTGDGRTCHNPVDTGWAWVILLSVFVIQFVCFGLVRAFGVLFVAVQLSFETSASTVALLGGVQSAVFSITALVVMTTIVEMTSVRALTLAGALTGVAGFVACSFASDVSHIIVIFSLCLGTAFGLTMGPGFNLMNAYFRRKLPVATAIVNTGGSIGSVVMPIATRMLLDEYFLSGAFLLLGGLFGQVLVFGSLLTPPQDYKPPQQTADRPPRGDTGWERFIQQQREIAKRARRERNAQRTVSESAVVGVRKNQDSTAFPGVTPLTQSLLAITDGKVHIRSDVLARGGQGRQGSWDAFVKAAGMGGPHSVSLTMLNFDHSLLLTDVGMLRDSLCREVKVEEIESVRNSGVYSRNPPDESSSVCIALCGKLSRMFDPVLFRSALFWLLAVYHFLSGLACGLPATFLPALAQEKGLSTTQGALLLTISGALDIVSRLVPGLLAQSGLVRPQRSVLVSLLVLGATFQLAGLAEGMAALTALSVLYGLFSGVLFSMLPLVILDFTDLRRFSQVFGFTQLSLGMSGFIGFLVVGYLKDMSGSYVTAFHFMGACGFAAAVVLLVMPALQRREAAGLSSNPERTLKGSV